MTNPSSTEDREKDGERDEEKDREKDREQDSARDSSQDRGGRAVLRAIRDPGLGLRRLAREGAKEAESGARHPSAAHRTPARRETAATSGAQVGASLETALGVLAVLLVGLVSAALSPL